VRPRSASVAAGNNQASDGRWRNRVFLLSHAGGRNASAWFDLGAPAFGDDNDIALNVALYALSVTTAGTFGFESFGHAAGGVEPYFTLFAGSGDAATFLESNLFDPLIDFSISGVALAGR
jgi:hypothetical protein